MGSVSSIPAALVVEDEVIVCLHIADIVEGAGFTAVEAAELQGLALCGHPCIANVHGTNLTRNYGTFKPLILWDFAPF